MTPAEQMGERLRASFALGTSLPVVGQLGFVVPDAAVARAQYGPVYGISQWYRANIRKCDLWMKNTPIKTDLSISIGYAGQLQIEIIEILGGDAGVFTSATTTDLAGLHHVGIFVHDARSWSERLEGIGVPTMEHGVFSFARRSKTRVAYVDVRPQVGVFAEFIEHRVRGQVLGMPHWLIRLGALFGEIDRISDPRSVDDRRIADRAA